MKRVLIITYYWPPAGGPGVQRWLKFAKYLPKYDVEPVIYVPENPHYPLRDETLLDEVPEGLKVIKSKIREPYGLANLLSKKNTTAISSGLIPEESSQGVLQRILLFVRGNFFIPDARKGWVKPSVKLLGKFIEQQEIEMVITSGPPHSLHLIGYHLKKGFNTKWIADFRDPWTQISYHKDLKLLPWSKKRHAQLERKVLDTADQLVVTSFTTRKEFEGKTSTPVALITNGFDEEDIVRVDPDPGFVITHTGSLLSGRNPEALWQALAELTREHEDFARQFRLRLVGAVGEQVVEKISQAGLRAYLRLEGYVTHQQAIEFQGRSSLLLLIEIDSEQTRAIIPGKIFEYMASGRHIVAFGPANADIEQLLENTSTGCFFTYDAKTQVKQHILEQFRKYQDGTIGRASAPPMRFSRQVLTGQLADLIKGLWE